MMGLHDIQTWTQQIDFSNKDMLRFDLLGYKKREKVNGSIGLMDAHTQNNRSKMDNREYREKVGFIPKKKPIWFKIYLR